ncbi:hypothetical protein HanOQP8_Chr02g0085321 [Helianthus annuus]|nr:hypothetical protein HanOQP8_Chr02g0085321 [Helianthus annuus]
MYGQPPRFHRPNGGRGQPPPQQQQQPPFNPNYLLNNNYYLQPNFPFPFPNIPIQNRSFDPHNQLANNRGVHVNGTIERIDKAVVKGRRELIAAGENVSALKVSQGVLVVLQADSWDSLGVQMQQVPSLYRLMAFEGKGTPFNIVF